MSSGFIVPYETQSTHGRVWVAWWSKLPRPPLALRIQNFSRPDTITQHAFGRSAGGDLIHYWWWAQQGWRAENLTQYASIGSAFRIALDPVVINHGDGDALTQHAFALNASGDLIHYWWWAQQGWRAENLTRYANIGNAYRIAGDPAAINLQSGDMATQHAFARNAAGDLIHYWWWADQGWRAENLTQYANIGSAYRIASEPAVINLQSGDTPTQHVFARNTAGDLIHYWWWAQQGWRAENLTTEYPTISTGYRILGDPVVTNLHIGEVPTQHAFARNANGELVHYYWSAQQGWQAENLTTGYPSIGDRYRIASDPAVIRLRAGETPTQHAFARNANSELIHYYWSAQQGWQAENLTRHSSVGSAYRVAGAPVSASAYQDAEAIG